MFKPHAIAIVGASADPTRIGGRPVHYLKANGFAGRIFPVNPSRETVQDLPAYPSLDALPGDIDLAILAIPAEHVPEAIEAAARKNAAGVVIFSSGFAEIGPEGEALQARITDRAAELGIHVMGPNTLGFYAAPSRTVATFSSLFERGPVPEGPVALVSQSGAFGAHLGIKAIKRGIGLRYWVTTGNEAGVSATDVIEALSRDPELRVIGVYLEGVKDGRALMTAISSARASGKRVVVIKVGRTPVGSRAAQSHTASLAGDDAVFDSAIARAGALRVKRTDEMLDALYALSHGEDLAGDRLGLLTVSGGAGVLMADAAFDAGFSVPSLPADTQARLREICPFGSPVNPVDVTAQSMNQPELITDHMRAMFQDGGCDAIVGFFMNWMESPMLAESVRRAVIAGADGFSDRTFALVANTDTATRELFEEQDMMVFDDPTGAIEALRQLGHQTGVPAARDWSDLGPKSGDLIAESLTEYDALKAVAAYGVSVPGVVCAATADEAGAAAETLGGRVVLKILSPDIAHKTEVGGVKLNLSGADEVRGAAAKMMAEVSKRVPSARIDGVLVSPMVSGVAECIVGARIDDVFGPVVMVGAGGIHAEVYRDVALSVAPVSREDAEAMLRSLRSWPLLDGARGVAKADVPALVETILALSDFVLAHRNQIAAVELNPVSVAALGGGARALDAYIERKAGA
ncbi:acetate--CoA ligase family protein [Roseibium aggregatum]|uniref:Acetate--CoA ligase family protein n=1 Tax=Roseibium aggregatum TaxID=187304 RepID=A0A939EJU4_9HYPH|nr:acetate--CoA ligase family protein [Roseibium aggregatum]MBN9672999.1 acetate--CoA ligase family protein [Roseibium aggregatum]